MAGSPQWLAVRNGAVPYVRICRGQRCRQRGPRRTQLLPGGDPVGLLVSACLDRRGRRVGVCADGEAGDLETVAVVILTLDDPGSDRASLVSGTRFGVAR